MTEKPYLSSWCRKNKCTHCYEDACGCDCHLSAEEIPPEGSEGAADEDAAMFDGDDEDEENEEDEMLE